MRTTIGDHATRITALTQWCGQLDQAQKSQELSTDDKIAQNAAVAIDDDSRIKQGLSLLETQAHANGAATAEL